MSIIEVEALAKTFKTRERAAGLSGSLRSIVAPRYRQREAVKPISFSLEPGELLAFIGPNGAGKSTTIKMLTMIANDGLWLFFWWTYFRQFPLVNGWQSSNIIVIWAVAACGFGIGMGVFGNTPKLAALIMNGGLDAYLGMPRNILLHVCIIGKRSSCVGRYHFRYRAFVLLLHPDLLHFVLFLLLSLLGALIFIAFLVILGSLAFFLGNTEGLSQQMLGVLVTFSTYPMNIFNGVVRVLLFTVVPAGFISFVPLQLLQHFSWPLFAGMIGFTLLFVGVAIGVFELGLKRYESGNLLGMQN